jgi:hypothetical protein
VLGNRPANLGAKLVDNHRCPYAGGAFSRFQIQVGHGRLNGTNTAAVPVVAAPSKKPMMIFRDFIFKEPASPAHSRTALNENKQNRLRQH